MGYVLQLSATEGAISYKYVDCRTCEGNGKVFSPHNCAFTNCPHCFGKGKVITDPICACGFPVTTVSEDKQFLYCGRKQCLTDLQADKKEDDAAKNRPSYMYRRDTSYTSFWPGYGDRYAE